MALLNAISFVNNKVKVKDGEPAVQDVLVFELGGKSALVELGNGKGKTTMVTLACSGFVTKGRGPGRDVYRRLVELFGPDDGPTWVAYEVIDTRRDIVPERAVNYIVYGVCGERGMDGNTVVRRMWAVVPKYYAGLNLSELPLYEHDENGFAPKTFADIREWARSVNGGTVYGRSDVGGYEEKLLEIGISSDEMAVWSMLNVSENGLHDYFSNMTTSESFFENGIMRVVKPLVNATTGGRDDAWACRAGLDIVDKRVEKADDIVLRNELKEYINVLDDCEDALAEVSSVRRDVTDFHNRMRKVREDCLASSDAAENRRIDLAGKREKWDEEVRVLRHMILSATYHERADELAAKKREREKAEADLDECNRRVETAEQDLADIAVQEAYADWCRAKDELDAAKAQFDAVKSSDQGRKLAVYENYLSHAARIERDSAKEASDSARSELSAAESRRDAAGDVEESAQIAVQEKGEAVGGAKRGRQERVDEFEEALRKQHDAENVNVPCMLDGTYDVSYIEELVSAAAVEAAAARASADALRADVDQASADRVEAERTCAAAEKELTSVSARFEVLESQRARVRESRTKLENAAARCGGVPFDIGDLERSESVAQAAFAAKTAEVEGRESEIEAARSELDAVRKGSERIPAVVKRALDEAGVRWRTLRDVAREKGLDVSMYIEHDRALADYLFVDEGDMDTVRDIVTEDLAGAAPVMVAVTGTDDLDRLVDGDGVVELVTNAVPKYICDPEKLIADIEASIAEREHVLSVERTVCDDMRELCSSISEARGCINPYSSYDDFDRTYDEAKHLVEKAGAELQEKKDAFEAAVTALEESKAALSKASDLAGELDDVLEQRKGLKDAACRANRAILELSAATEACNEAKAALEAARKSLRHEEEIVSTCRSRADAAIAAFRKADELLALHDGDGEEDPEGRSASALDEIVRRLSDKLKANEDELKRKVDFAAQVLLDKRKELDTRLEKAHRGLDWEHIGEYDPARGVHADREMKDAESARTACKKVADDAVRAWSSAEAAETSALRDLESDGYDSPIEKSKCAPYDTCLSLKRKKQHDIEEADKELKEIERIASKYLEAATAASTVRGGLTTVFDVYDDGSEIVGVETELSELIERIDNGKVQAAELNESVGSASEMLQVVESELFDLARSVKSSRVASLVSSTQSPLDRISRHGSSHEVDELSKMITGRKDNAAKCLVTVDEKLDSLDSDFENLANALANDAVEAVRAVAEIEKSCKVAMDLPDGTRKDVRFLSMSLGGSKLRMIRPGDDDAIDEVLPAVRDHLEKCISYCVNKVEKGSERDEVRKVIEKKLDLSRIIRIAVAGDDLAKANVKFALCKEEEIVTDQNWDARDARAGGGSAWKGSGAERFVMENVLFMAITRYTRAAQMGGSLEHGDTFAFMDNPFSVITNERLLRYYEQILAHFHCQVMPFTAINMAGVQSIFPTVYSLAVNRVTSDGRRLFSGSSTGDGNLIVGSKQKFGSLRTTVDEVSDTEKLF